MKFFDKIKKKIINNIPAGRRYIDKKMNIYDKRFCDLQNSIQDMNNKIVFLTKKIEELKTDIKLQNEIIENYKNEKKNDIDNKKRIAQLEWQAKGKSIWIIKTPVPNNEYKQFWGEYYFALSLKKYLERLNVFVLIDNRDNIYDEIEADVILVLRSKKYYVPDRRNKKCKYIMWNICHPTEVTIDEYELYDVVCIASNKYSKYLKNKINVPVIPLLQCTDTELFYPIKDKRKKKYDYIFVGNTRNAERECVNWALGNKIDLKVWGREWEKQFSNYKEFVVDNFILNNDLPDLYRNSKVTFNDHWQDMKDCSFVNNRTFDALACGLPIISDYVEELEDLFGDAILCYKSEEDFVDCLKKMEKDYSKIKKKVEKLWPLIKDKYSFEVRASELVEIVNKIDK